MRQRAREAARHNQLTLMEDEAGRWPSGHYSRNFKYPLRTGMGTGNDDLVQITWWVGNRADEMVRLLRNAEFSGSLSDLHVSFCSHFLLHTYESLPAVRFIS